MQAPQGKTGQEAKKPNQEKKPEKMLKYEAIAELLNYLQGDS
jgi:hypothetical protein